MFRRVLSAAVLVVLGAVLLIAAWPQLLGIQREAGVVQATTMRGLLTAVALLGVVLFVLVAAVGPTVRRFAGGAALLLLLSRASSWQCCRRAAPATWSSRRRSPAI